MRAYEETLVGPMFEPWAEVLLDELSVGAGQQLLDVATGPGTLARLAAVRLGRTGRVAACDLSSAMLALAREKAPLFDGAPIEYVECPAASLPMPADAYDVVACQQGLQFFPDRPAALAEMRRVLKAGGRLGVAVWSAIDRCPPVAALADAVEVVMGNETADRYRTGPWGLPGADQLAELIDGAGFEQVRVTERRLPVTFAGGPAQLVASLAASGIAADYAALDTGRRQALEAKAAELMSPLLAEGRVESEVTSNIATAVKPG
jgi:SAM-dependent methyltransferase